MHIYLHVFPKKEKQVHKIDKIISSQSPWQHIFTFNKRQTTIFAICSVHPSKLIRKWQKNENIPFVVVVDWSVEALRGVPPPILLVTVIFVEIELTKVMPLRGLASGHRYENKTKLKLTKNVLKECMPSCDQFIVVFFRCLLFAFIYSTNT